MLFDNIVLFFELLTFLGIHWLFIGSFLNWLISIDFSLSIIITGLDFLLVLLTSCLFFLLIFLFWLHQLFAFIAVCLRMITIILIYLVVLASLIHVSKIRFGLISIILNNRFNEPGLLFLCLKLLNLLFSKLYKLFDLLWHFG